MSILISSGSTLSNLEDLISQGINGFVFQSQSLNATELKEQCREIRQLAEKRSAALSIIFELSTHRPYLQCPTPLLIKKGNTLVLCKTNDEINKELTQANYIGNLPKELYREDSFIDIAGAPRALRVVAVKGEQLFCEAEEQFILRSGLYLDYEINGECVPAFSEPDFDNIEKGIDCQVDYFLLPQQRSAERYDKLQSLLKQRNLTQKVLTFDSNYAPLHFQNCSQLSFSSLKENNLASSIVNSPSLQLADNSAARREIQWLSEAGVRSFCLDALSPRLSQKIKFIAENLQQKAPTAKKQNLLEASLLLSQNMELNHTLLICDNENCLQYLSTCGTPLLLLSSKRNILNQAAFIPGVLGELIPENKNNSSNALTEDICSRHKLSGKVMCLYNSRGGQALPDKLRVIQL